LHKFPAGGKMKGENKSKSKNSRPRWGGLTMGDYFMQSPEISAWLGLKPQPYPITSTSNNNVVLNNVQIKTSSNNVNVKDVSVTTSSNHVPKTLDILRKFNNDLENNVIINDLKDALQQRKLINNIIFGRYYVFKITYIQNNVMNVVPMTYDNYKFDELTITFDDDEKQLLNNAFKNDKDAELNDVANDVFYALKNDNITNVSIIDVLNNVKRTNLIYGKKYDYIINEFELHNNNGKYELTINVTVMTKDKHEKMYDVSITFNDDDLTTIGGGNDE